MSLQMDRQASARSELELMLIDENKEPKALPLSLLANITNGFSGDNEIGRGGFAVVYKGILDNGIVAVKKLSSAHSHEDEFNREVECLLIVKHKNIVRFLGYCADTQGSMENYNGKMVMAELQEKLLCFEYVPKGSLRDYISDASKGFEWRARFQIIKGICEGLYYLHLRHIVHLDLKPENILLDNNNVPKITDFGISRCFDQNQIRATFSRAIGTTGYMAPEWFDSVKFSLKSDIYSIGVIILEILTGDRYYTEYDYIIESWSKRLGESQKNRQLEQIRLCVEIAMECIDHNPEDRPDCRSIICRLDKMERAEGSNEIHVSSSSAKDECQSWTRLENLQGHTQQSEVSFDESEEPKDMTLLLLKKITSGFSPDKKIESGSGEFAVFYKGMLGNRVVAVKRLSNTHMYDVRFEQEIRSLMSAKHENIIRLLGYCSETAFSMEKHNGNIVMVDAQERLLCLEYFPKGSLDKYITDASRGLEWSKRYRIIKGLCEGLCYLHKNDIVYLGLKPVDILLDDNFVPKISDFGLSSFSHKGQRRKITKDTFGTTGYMAPELLDGGFISYKVDIYSLGIVIMELLTGQKCKLSVEDVLESWNKRLDRSDGDTRLDQVQLCAEIGRDCVEFDPVKRPDIQHIIDRLNGTKKADRPFEGRDFVEFDHVKRRNIQHIIELKGTKKADGPFKVREYNYSPLNNIAGYFSPDQRIGIGSFGMVYGYERIRLRFSSQRLLLNDGMPRVTRTSLSMGRLNSSAVLDRLKRRLDLRKTWLHHNEALIELEKADGPTKTGLSSSSAAQTLEQIIQHILWTPFVTDEHTLSSSSVTQVLQIEDPSRRRRPPATSRRLQATRSLATSLHPTVYSHTQMRRFQPRKPNLGGRREMGNR